MKKITAIILMFIMVLCLSPMTVHAKSYPIVYVNSTESNLTIPKGEEGVIAFCIWPEYKNEKIIINIYDEYGNEVAYATESFYQTSYLRDFYLSVDTDELDLDVGEYTIEYYMQYYSYMEWRTCPSTYTDTFYVIKNKCKGNHSYIFCESVTSGSCTNPGRDKYECKKCGNIIYKDGKFGEHSWDDGDIITYPTEFTAGEILYTCVWCEETKMELMDPLGHTIVIDNAVPPTCTTTGLTEGSHCLTCGEIIKMQEIVPESHDWNNGIADKLNGIIAYKCYNCEATKTEIYNTDNISRLYGKNRFETSYAISNALRLELEVEKFDTVIIANGMNYPDALAGSYLAAKKKAPILMVNTKSADSIKNIKAYINRNLQPNGKIYILGGTGAVSNQVTVGLTGYKIERISGKNRYDTNLMILEEAGVKEEDILVCTGTGFADSLSASATGYPILLVGDSLTDAQKTFLNSVKGNNFYIIGGSAAVSENVEKALGEYGATERISGKSRFETSIKLAEKFFTGVDDAVVAYAHNFPDGLCGGPLAYNLNAPLILTGADMSKKPNSAGEATAATVAISYMTENSIKDGVVLGGSGVLSDNTVRLVFGMKPSEVIVDKKFN